MAWVYIAYKCIEFVFCQNFPWFIWLSVCRLLQLDLTSHQFLIRINALEQHF